MRLVSTADTISTYDGYGDDFYAPDGTATASTEFASSTGIAMDPVSGMMNLCGCGEFPQDVQLSVSTYTGTGTMGDTGDGGDALSASVSMPFELFLNTTADSNYVNRIRGVISPKDLLTAAPIPPSIAPTAAPTTQLSVAPTTKPSVGKSAHLSILPALMPSVVPSFVPIVFSEVKTAVPSVTPSSAPTVAPSDAPTEASTIDRTKYRANCGSHRCSF